MKHLKMVMLTLGILACTCTAGSNARAADPLILSYSHGNAIYWDLNVAIERGFFKDEGFEPSFVALMSSPAAIQQIVAGAINIGASSPEPIVDAVSRGASDLGILAGPAAGVDWTLNVKPEIRSLADLKGKRIGVSTIKGSESSLIRDLLKQAGLGPSDYEFIQTGLSTAKLAALQRGSIDAAALLPPSNLVAAQNGLPIVADFSTVKNFPYPVYATSRKWAHADQHGVRVSRAIVKAQKWLHDPSNRSEAIKILQKYTKQSDEILGKTYDFYFGPKGSYLSDGKVELAGLSRLMTTMKENGSFSGDIVPQNYVISASDGGLSKP